jgi:quercetin dioxygenase-like cupin family protein
MSGGAPGQIGRGPEHELARVGPERLHGDGEDRAVEREGALVHRRQHGGREPLEVEDLAVGLAVQGEGCSRAVPPRVDELHLGLPDGVGVMGAGGGSRPRRVEGQPRVAPAQEEQPVDIQRLVRLVDVGDVEEIDPDGHLGRPRGVGARPQGAGERGDRRRRGNGPGRRRRHRQPGEGEQERDDAHRLAANYATLAPMPSDTRRAVATVQVDNPLVRVTEWRFAPGAATGHHRHELDYVVVPLTTGALRLVGASGETTADLVAGQAYFRAAGVEHDVHNPNPFDFAFVEIELKRRGPS